MSVMNRNTWKPVDFNGRLNAFVMKSPTLKDIITCYDFNYLRAACAVKRQRAGYTSRRELGTLVMYVMGT